MQALNLQLDIAPAAQLPDARAGQGKTGALQAESSFGRELDKAIAGSTDGQQQITQTDSSRENRVAEAERRDASRAVEKTADGAERAETAETAEKTSSDPVERLLTDNRTEDASAAEQEPAVEIHIGRGSFIEETPDAGLAETETALQKEGEAILASIDVEGDSTEGAAGLFPETAALSAQESVLQESAEQPVETHKKERKAVVKESAENAPLIAQSAGTAEQAVPEMVADSVVQAAAGSAATAEKRKAPVISVSDLRTQPEGVSGVSNPAGIPDGAQAVTFAATNSLTEIAGDAGMPKGESRFTQLLSKEIQNSAGELVKTGSIILRDNNAGTINLVLHPEELGNVKIQLELTDRLISGKITVASQEAFNAFKANLETLRAAFAESGFETAGFDLNWSGSGNGGGSNDGGGREQNPRGMYYADLMPQASGGGEEVRGSYALSSVDVMA